MKKSELKYLINECIQEVLNEEQERKAILAELENLSLEELKTLHEGVFGDIWQRLKNQVKAAIPISKETDKKKALESLEVAMKEWEAANSGAKDELKARIAKKIESDKKTADTQNYVGEFKYDPKSNFVVWKMKPTVGSAGGSGVQLENK